MTNQYSLDDPLIRLHKEAADKLGLTMEEYTELGKTIKPEDIEDPPLPHLHNNPRKAVKPVNE